MGKKSTKENKNIYQIARENCELTREKASEEMEIVSSDRIERIESGKSLPHPDEILLMADCYKAHNLCNYYCSHECPIGQEYVPEVRSRSLSEIVLEILNSLNTLEREKERLIEITVDGRITNDELQDFNAISQKLNELSATIDSLQLWIRQTASDMKNS